MLNFLRCDNHWPQKFIHDVQGPHQPRQLHWYFILEDIPGLEVSPSSIQPHTGPLLGFSREWVKTRGYVDLMTTFGQGQLFRSFTIRYLIFDANTFLLLFDWQENTQRARSHCLHITSKDKVPHLDGRDHDCQGRSKASTTVLRRKPEGGTLSSH